MKIIVTCNSDLLALFLRDTSGNKSSFLRRPHSLARGPGHASASELSRPAADRVSSHVVCIMDMQLCRAVATTDTVRALSQAGECGLCVPRMGLLKTMWHFRERGVCHVIWKHVQLHVWSLGPQPGLKVWAGSWHLTGSWPGRPCRRCDTVCDGVWHGVVGSRRHHGGRRCGVMGVAWCRVAGGREGKCEKSPRGAAFLSVCSSALKHALKVYIICYILSVIFQFPS